MTNLQPSERPLRVLHIGNIANNAYLAAKMLNEKGLDCDVICRDYYHVMGCPEWEEVDFTGDIGDSNYPDWRRVDLHGFERPRWFAQGQFFNCIHYLIAKRENDQEKAEKLWKALEEDRHEIATFYGKPHPQTEKANPVKLFIYRLYRSRYVRNPAGMLLYGLRKFRKKLRNVIGFGKRAGSIKKSRPEEIDEELVSIFAQIYPDRPDQLQAKDMQVYRVATGLWEKLFKHYDIIHAYSIDPIWPMLAGTHPYIAFEHGTIRDIPFENNAQGRLTALAYYLADGVIITNADNQLAAKKLKLSKHRFIPHPMNEQWNYAGVSGGLREELKQKLNADFIIFHPARQHWEKVPTHNPGMQKGNNVLIEGFARFVNEVNPNATLIMVDWGTSVAQSKALVDELGIAHRVHWLPLQNSRKMSCYVDACDVVADQFWLGAFGGIPPRALALGKPTLLRFDNTIHEWAFPEMPPFISVETGDQVFEGLKKLYLDPVWYQRISHQSQVWYQRYHSNQAISRATFELYQLAIARTKGV